VQLSSCCLRRFIEFLVAIVTRRAIDLAKRRQKNNIPTYIGTTSLYG